MPNTFHSLQTVDIVKCAERMMSMLLSKVMKRIVVGTFAVVGSVVFAQNVPVGKASEAAFKIDLGNLLKIPVGNTLVDTGFKRTTWNESVASIDIPPEWSEDGKCRALRTSNVLADNRRLVILGGLGSCVYPTIPEGVYVITNEIIKAVAEVSGGTAMAVPMRFEKKKGYGEMIFTWKPDPKKNVERELIVRGYVNRARQMAVCCCLHTIGDGITADYIPPPVMSDPDQKPKDGGS